MKKHRLLWLSLASLNTVAIAAIPTIVVTNARYTQELDDVIGATTVIGKKEITESLAQTVLDLLRTTVGINVASSGGKGAVTSIFIRGLANKHTLVLIDGVRVSSAVDGTFSWENLDLAIVEKIEIVRGAKSSLYGADAMGGVIQIFTKKTSGYSLKQTFGSYGTKKSTLSVGVNKKSAGGSITISKEKTNGFSATNKTVGSSFNNDNDTQELDSVAANFWVRLTDNISLSGSLLAGNTVAGFDFGSATTNTTELENNSQTLKFEHRVNDRWNYSIQLSQSKHKSDSLSNTVSTYLSNTKRDQASFINHFSLAGNIISLGFDGIKTTTTHPDFSAFPGTPKTLTNKQKALFLNLSGTKGKFAYDLGFRKNTHSKYSAHNTYSIGLGYNITPRLRISTSHGTSFKAPSAFELVGLAGTPGNPDLKPERARTSSVDLTYNKSRSHFLMSFYETKVYDDVIFTNNSFENIIFSKIQGFEASYNINFNDWDFSTAISILDTQDKEGKTLIRRPNKITFRARKHFNTKGNIGLETILVGKAKDHIYDPVTFAPNEVTLHGYGLTNLSGKYNLNRNLSFGIRINNVFDKKYQTIRGYNTPERAYYATLEYKGRW